LFRLQPDAQQPSPSVQDVISVMEHAALQLVAEPVSRSFVHLFPSSHDAGQLPSHISPGSTVPLPQDAEQSLSVTFVHPSAQQPSSPVHEPTGS
jgi:hypothetical protein